MAEKTLREFSAPSTENIHTGPTLKSNNLEFELKPSLINMVQATPFSGKAHEDASAHLQNFLEISSTITIKDVAQDIILLHLFPFSLVGRAKQWFYINKRRHQYMGKVFKGLHRKVLSSGQDQCLKRKDF